MGSDKLVGRARPGSLDCSDWDFFVWQICNTACLRGFDKRREVIVWLDPVHWGEPALGHFPTAQNLLTLRPHQQHQGDDYDQWKCNGHFITRLSLLPLIQHRVNKKKKMFSLVSNLWCSIFQVSKTRFPFSTCPSNGSKACFQHLINCWVS